jgi:hypothetical protein
MAPFSRTSECPVDPSQYRTGFVNLRVALSRKSTCRLTGPCETTDIGFIDKQRHVHFKGHPTDGEICDVVSRLADSGYLQS